MPTMVEREVVALREGTMDGRFLERKMPSWACRAEGGDTKFPECQLVLPFGRCEDDPARMDVASIIAAARSNMKKSTDETNISSSKETEETESSSLEESEDEINDEDGDVSGSESDGSVNNESSSEDDSEDEEGTGFWGSLKPALSARVVNPIS